MKHPATITSLPLAPQQERRARMIKYSITMGIRLVCIFACFWVQGWWLLVPAIGAIVLPYVAVVIANVHAKASRAAIVGPGALLPSPRKDEDR